MREFVRMVVVLFIVCGLSAASLAVMNGITKEPIARYEKQKQEEALRAVFPQADEFANTQPDKVWDALRGGRRIGRVFKTREQGYSGPITLMFGLDSSGAVTGLRVLSHTETPGLGAKIREDKFTDKFKAKRPEQLRIDKDGGQIDAITGATISSRAVTRAMSKTIDAFTAQKAGGDK